MKQKDLLLIIVVAVISLVASLFVSKLVFSSPAMRSQTVDVVAPLSSNFPIPNNRYFNAHSIDPTQLITIGNNNNLTPFNNVTQ